MKKMILNGLLTSIFLIVMSVGISLTLKADIGTGSINAISASISWISGVHVGTVLMLINVLCVIVQWGLLQKEFHWRNWLQIGVAALLGSGVNIIFYHLLSDWVITHYYTRLILFFCGTVVSCLGISVILHLNLVSAPVESLAVVVSKKTNKSFKFIRQSIDIIVIALAVLLTLIYQVEWSIREGTILNALIFSSIIQFFLNILEKGKWFEKIRLK